MSLIVLLKQIIEATWETLCVPPGSVTTGAGPIRRQRISEQGGLAQADIVVIGDSYIEAPMVPDDILATTPLSRLEGRTVGNLGNSGYGPQQELSVLKRFALPLRPDTVVWAFFEGNDFANTEEYDTNMVLVAGENPAWQNFGFESLSRNLLALYFRSTKACQPNARI